MHCDYCGGNHTEDECPEFVAAQRRASNLPVLASENMAHASLGASSAARWMACPGSVALIEALPPGTGTGSSFASSEGTAAHDLANMALLAGKDADAFIGTELHGHVVTEEMAEHVQLFVDHVRTPRHPGTIHWYEQRFSLDALKPPVPMFGTADHAAYEPDTRTLYVDDLKYGAGVMVEVEGNAQTRYYALGAILSLDLTTHPVDRIVVTIVQPRKDHDDGPVRSETLTLDEIRAFSRELLKAAHETLNPDAALVPGDHCRWCRAKGVCPALHSRSQEIAAVEFDDMPAVLPPAPATLTNEQIGMLLQKLPLLDEWSKAVKDHAEEILLQGGEVPGFKMVAKRANRKWVDEDTAAETLFEIAPRIGVGTIAELYEKPALKSPAQVEKLFKGKKKFETIMAGHVTKKSSGLKLVPESHSSPAVLSAGAEFEFLPEASSADNTGTDTEE